MKDEVAAKIILKCMDLTSLNNDDSTFRIESLLNRAKTQYGDVASICIFEKFVEFAKVRTDIKIATVINFPHGLDNVKKIKKDIDNAVVDGACEVDIVFPYRAFLEKNYKDVDAFLMMINGLDKALVSKIILETGEFDRLTKIVDATKLCLEAGAKFIKTSTGKTKIGATPEVANIILETIASYPKKAGFKASGGIKTLEDAKKYVILAESIMGYKWVRPENFRIGASSLLEEVIKCLSKI